MLSLLDDFIGALRLEAKLQDPRRVLVQAITSSRNAPFCVAAAPGAAVPDSKRGVSRSWTVQNPGKIDLGRDGAHVRTQKKQRRPTKQIHVQTPSGRTITLQVKLTDTIEQVKQRFRAGWAFSPTSSCSSSLEGCSRTDTQCPSTTEPCRSQRSS